jgi:hypothetical protein
VRNDSISRLFVFSEDYSEIFFDFTLSKKWDFVAMDKHADLND